MADHKVKKSGSWIVPGSGAVNAKLGGSWQIVSKVWAKSGGVWTEVWTNANPPIWTAGSTAALYGSPYVAGVFIYADGSIVLNNGANGSWLPSGGTAANYRIKWQLLSGSTPTASSGFSANTWVALSTSRSLTISGTSTTVNSCTVRFTLEETATGAQHIQDVFMEGGGFV